MLAFLRHNCVMSLTTDQGTGVEADHGGPVSIALSKLFRLFPNMAISHKITIQYNLAHNFYVIIHGHILGASSVLYKPN